VSNNYSQAVVEYLARVGLSAQVAHIIGRNPADPTLMKPSPHLIEKAIRALGVERSTCALIGDQTTDIEAGRAGGVPTIGYANKPGKVDALKGPAPMSSWRACWTWRERSTEGRPETQSARQIRDRRGSAHVRTCVSAS
jgi:beta-phosphoglucomutase-like phosphatase (HAD superfamily)